MTTVSLKCENCGADLEVDKNREFCLCSFCGSKIMIEKEEYIYRLVDEAKLKELEYSRLAEEKNRKLEEEKQKRKFKIKLILLVIWMIIVAALFILSKATMDSVGFSPYQLLLIPILIFGIIIIVKEVINFMK